MIVLREERVDKMPLGTEVIPLQSPQLWCKYYRLMGRPQKVDMIEKALFCEHHIAAVFSK